LDKLLILFVHGLGGGSGTWGSFKALIEADPQLSGKVETAFFSYPTKLFNVWPFSRSLRTQEISDALRTEIDRRYAGKKRILLIAHSLGGLVAKRYIIEALQRQTPLRIGGLVFFATPHSGAGLAIAVDLLSVRHWHGRQLRRDSDFLNLITREWNDMRCDSKLSTVYVVAGQDQVVDINSAGGPPGTLKEMVSEKGHIDEVKPENANDLSFLIVKQTALRLLQDGNKDLSDARTAILERDEHSLLPLVANKGRSWIETADADTATDVLESISLQFAGNAQLIVWSQYLLAIARLFKYRDASSTAFDDSLTQKAESIGLGPLIQAERMEFARKRGDRETAAAIAHEVIERLRIPEEPASSDRAYAVGTAFFLLGNLCRSGGSYDAAMEFIGRARAAYRPAILAHQIELAHCRYAYAVCHAMKGIAGAEAVQTVSVAAEFRPFADALLTLTLSHTEWSLGRTGEAAEQAIRAGQAFEQIRFTEYARRARSLVGLLGAWQRLELGATPDQAIATAPDYAPVLRGMLGQPTARGTLFEKIPQMRPSLVLGLLQFASTYNENWTVDIGVFNLPPILTLENGNGAVRWNVETARSLAEADKKLRVQMGITSDVRVPLIAD
jgi:tetratricopeptide (TPR) repeat protein